MFIDCTGIVIQLDPDQYPTGLVVQILSVHPPGKDRVGHIFSENSIELDPHVQEPWLFGRTRGHRYSYSLTEYDDITVIEEGDGYSFTVQGYYLDLDNNMVVREFQLSVVDRPGIGWTTEINDEDTLEHLTVGVRMPRFNPRAVVPLINEPLEVEEKPEEKPPGRPIWERLDEED